MSNNKKLKKIGASAPNKLPSILDEDIDILQSFMDSAIANIEELKVLVKTLRQKVVEESSSKITIAQYDELNTKFLNLNEKMLGIKKDSLLVRKQMKSEQKFDNTTTIITRKNNEEVEVLREELGQLKDAVTSNITEIKKSQEQLIRKGLDDVAKQVVIADELPIVEEVIEKTIDEKTLSQIMKQLYKNNEDIASLQRQLHEKTTEIEELKNKLGNK